MKAKRDKIHACIASIPARENSLVKTIHSLLPQVDRICLYLNDYSKESVKRIQDISKEKITIVVGDNKLYGDAGKFYWASKLSGYILTCDDDLIYPPDYAQVVVSGIEKYHRLAIVSFHGRILITPIKPYSYAVSHISFPTFNSELKLDLFVHIAGTGVMGFHSSTVKPEMKDFPSVNMADTHMGILAQKNKVPICVLSHQSNWIIEMRLSDTSSITSSRAGNYLEHERRVNEIKDWKLWKVDFVSPKEELRKESKSVNGKSNNGKIADIVIPHHDRHDHLKNLLSLLGNDLFNIVIVSGGSFASNCNKGARLTETDRIIFLNDDTLPKPEDLIKLAEALSNYDIVGSTQNVNGQKYYGMSLFEFHGKLEPRIDSETGRSIFSSGFCIAVRKDKWDTLGGFDERFRTGHEDVDFGFRAIEQGMKIGLLDLEIKHICNQSSGRMRYVLENTEMLHKLWSQDKLNFINQTAKKIS